MYIYKYTYILIYLYVYIYIYMEMYICSQIYIHKSYIDRDVHTYVYICIYYTRTHKYRKNLTARTRERVNIAQAPALWVSILRHQ